MAEQTKRTRPCDACRRRKTKCLTQDGNIACVLCLFHGQECSYKEPPKPRKRTLSHDSASQNGLPAVKRKAAVPKDLGKPLAEYDALEGPSLLKRTLGLQKLHHARYVGLNDSIDPDHAAHYCNKTQRVRVQADTSVKIRWVHPLHAFKVLPDEGTPDYDREAADLESIEKAVGHHGPELVKLYFRLVHPAFPVLHKDVFLEKYTRTHMEFAPSSLAAVYLLASGYWNFSETLSASPKPDFTELRQLAHSSLRGSFSRPKLSTVQAALLLSQYQATHHAPQSSDVEAEALTTQLVELAYTLGLHLDPHGWEIPDWEIGLRRRLSWAVFTQDTWKAFLGGRPPLVSNEAWDVDELTDADFPEHVEERIVGSSEVVRGRLVFMRMTSLSVILSTILSRILRPRFQQELFASTDKVGRLLEELKPLQIQLKDWSATLPESLKMDTSASMKLSSVGYLRLAYLAVEASIHRRLIKAISGSLGVDATLWRVCYVAAQERLTAAIDFVQRLQAPHLASFWYSSSAHCCMLIYHLGRALEAISDSGDMHDNISQKLAEYKWTLKVNGNAGASFMNQALDMIDQADRVTIMPFSGAASVTESPLESRTNVSPRLVTLGGNGDTSSTQRGLSVEQHRGETDTFDLTFSPRDLDFPDFYDIGNTGMDSRLAPQISHSPFKPDAEFSNATGEYAL